MRSVVADRVSDAFGTTGDILANIADVLARAADGVAGSHAAQHGGTDDNEEEFAHNVSDSMKVKRACLDAVSAAR